MHHLDPLTARNRTFAATGAHVGVSVMPRNQVYVITCLDPRVDPAAFLGVGLGDAMVVRNAGGRVTDEVVKDVAFISYLAEVMVGDGPLFQVAVIHHTQCGTGFLADAGFRSGFAARSGLDEAALAAEAVLDPGASVRVDVERLLSAPSVSRQITVSGHVYDVESGLVSTVLTPAGPHPHPVTPADRPPDGAMGGDSPAVGDGIGSSSTSPAA